MISGQRLRATSENGLYTFKAWGVQEARHKLDQWRCITIR